MKKKNRIFYEVEVPNKSYNYKTKRWAEQFSQIYCTNLKRFYSIIKAKNHARYYNGIVFQYKVKSKYPGYFCKIFDYTQSNIMIRSKEYINYDELFKQFKD